MSTVSAVIRSYNEERHIGRLLTGILKQATKVDEILLVDSGSTDATLEIASRFPVRILSISPEEFSFGASLNRGCQAAQGNLIVIASAHVFPIFDDWLDQLLQPFTDPNVAVAYGRQVADQSARVSERQILRAWFPPHSVRRQGHPFCNNANAAIRRSVWEDHPYDEELTGLEDLDWAKRVMDVGHHVSYVAEAAVVHVHQESIRQIINRYQREALAHKRIFNGQHVTAVDALRLAGINILADYWRAAREGKMLENLLDIPAFRIAQFWGTYSGFRQKGPVPTAMKRRFYYPAQSHTPTGMAERLGNGNAIDYGGGDATG